MRDKKLDGLRFLTALYVVVHHCLDMYAPDTKWSIPLRLGQVAVLVFFVLSGYFMNISLSRKKNLGFMNYLKHRLIRLYPIYIVAIFLPIIVVFIFNTWSSISVPLSIKNLFGSIFFFQDLGRYPNVAFTTWYNAPLWSLSYEMYFYIVHFLLFKINEGRAYEMLIFISLFIFLIFPNKLAMNGIYFIYYYIGIMLAKKEISRIFKIVAVMPIIGILLLLKLSNYNTNYLILHWLLSPGLLFLYLITRNQFRYNWILSFSFGASISYGIYALHFPLMVNLPELLNMEPNIFLFLIGAILTVSLSWILEVKLHKYLNIWIK